MNHANTQPSLETYAGPSLHLLDTIRFLLARIGDGLNHDELTRLLRQTPLPAEAGFAFWSFSDEWVTLRVPPQDLADWYQEEGRIVPSKAWIAGLIAEEYELSLNETPDLTSRLLFPPSAEPNIHYHLELSNRGDTIVVAHPNYLKVRMFGNASVKLYGPDARKLVPLGPDLLQALSALYEGKEEW